MLSIKIINQLENDLNHCLSLKTNILLFEHPHSISLIDKIKIIEENKLEILNISLIRQILFYLLDQKLMNHILYDYFKSQLITKTF